MQEHCDDRNPPSRDRNGARHRIHRGLGLYDSTMVVVGSMIGSGIFIVSADMARNVGSPGLAAGRVGRSPAS